MRAGHGKERRKNLRRQRPEPCAVAASRGAKVRKPIHARLKTSDWVIDLGPEGGERGGRIVAEGTPEQVAQCAESYTGQFLREASGSVEALTR